MPDFPKIKNTFGVTPYNPDREDDPDLNRQIFEHYKDQMGAQPLAPEQQPYNKPFPPGVAMQEAFDNMLQQRVVDPLAQSGYEGLGAGLAAIPSAAHSMVVPQTEFDAAAAAIPMGKFGKIRNAMTLEKQAAKEIPQAAEIGIGKVLSKEKLPQRLNEQILGKNYDESKMGEVNQVMEQWLAKHYDTLTEPQKEAAKEWVNAKINSDDVLNRFSMMDKSDQFEKKSMDSRIMKPHGENVRSTYSDWQPSYAEWYTKPDKDNAYNRLGKAWENLNGAFGSDQTLIIERDPRFQELRDMMNKIDKYYVNPAEQSQFDYRKKDKY